MNKTARSLMMLLAVVAGIGASSLTSYAVSSTDLVTLCFRGRTIQVPFYLAYKYYAFGAVDGECPTSNL
jgi:ABC-type sugar transport system substrate-binding protein